MFQPLTDHLQGDMHIGLHKNHKNTELLDAAKVFLWG
jgi:hypothetical protein